LGLRQNQGAFRREAIAEARRLDPQLPANLSGYQAHHIVPLREYPQLSELRGRLARLGIDLNDAKFNSVMLPTARTNGPGTLHSDTQRNASYERALVDRFAGVQTREQALFELGKIRDDLRAGTFIPSKGP
jgi:hypothetical protein